MEENHIWAEKFDLSFMILAEEFLQNSDPIAFLQIGVHGNLKDALYFQCEHFNSLDSVSYT